jgi:sugar phosphate isomerase/epimerase
MGVLGLGSYAFRWSCGFRDVIPQTPLGPLDLLETARRLGLGLVQFADNLPMHLRPADEIDAVARTARRTGIAIELGMAGFDRAAVEVHLDLARRLDAALLRISFDRAEAELGMDGLVARIREVLPAARAAGVRLAAENHFGFPSRLLAEVAERTGDDHFGVCLDVANSICAGEWPSETIAVLAPHAINLHLKDYEILPDPYGVGFRILGTPLGTGRIDVPAVLGALADHRRDVDVILEHWLPRRETEAATLAAETDWLTRSVSEARRHGL